MARTYTGCIIALLLLFSIPCRAQWNDYSGFTYTIANNDTGTVNALTIYMSRNTTGPLTWYLPASNGTSGQVLTTNGANPALLSWTSLSSGVTSVANSDGTLTISPTTGAVVASLNLAHANTWTAAMTIHPSTVALPLLLWQDDASTDILQARSSSGAVHVIIDPNGLVPLENTSGYPATADAIVAGAATSSGYTQQLAMGTSGQLLRSNGASALASWTTPTQGIGSIITSASGSITIADSERTFNVYHYETGNYTINSSDYSTTTNCIVECNIAGGGTITVPPSIVGNEIIIYQSTSNDSVTVALGTGAHFIGGATTVGISPIAGDGVRLVGVAPGNGYYLVEKIP